MNPKLHCSRDASVSHDRLKTTVAIQRKLHTRLRPLVFHHFFPADSFFLLFLSLSFFFHNSLSVPRDANIKVIRIAKRGIVRTNKEREREREEKRKTNKQKKKKNKDFTKIERDSKNHAAVRLSFPSFIFETRHFATVSSNVNDRRN